MNTTILTILLASRAAAADTTYPLLRYSDIADGRPVTMEEGFVLAYETAYGFTMRPGDLLVIGVPTGSSAQAVGVGGGGVLGGAGVGGARATAVSRAYFSTIANGTQAATIGKALLVGLAGAPDPATFMAPASMEGVQVRVARMKLVGTKKRPQVSVECTVVQGMDRANASGVVTVTDYDEALRSGEIFDARRVTRELAIQRLKEAKDLLDIGVWTQEQFEAEKALYLPFVQPTAPGAAPQPASGAAPTAPAVAPANVRASVQVSSMIGSDGAKGVAALEQAIEPRNAELAACFAAPGVAVRVTLAIKKTGEIADVSPSGGADPAAASCVATIFATVRTSPVPWVTKVSVDTQRVSDP